MKNTWDIELVTSDEAGGGYCYVGATEVEFLGGGEISFLDFSGKFHRTTLPYLVTKAEAKQPEHIPDPRDEEPWSDTQTAIERVNSIKGR